MSKNAKAKQEVKITEPPPKPITPVEAGIVCPRCCFPLRVYRTKKLTGEVVRERICDRCREKQETTEKLDKD